MTLNKSQELAEKRLVRFLMDPDEKGIILNAPSGYGKTYLMNHIIHNMETYQTRAAILDAKLPNNIVFAAPTNKAASNGYMGGTIHKHLGLVLDKNFTTGKYDLVQKAPLMLPVMVADEWSAIGSDVLKHINTSVKKVIYTGDGHQLPPVKHRVSPIAKLGLPSITLTEPMRQNVNSGLFKMCQHLRTMVDQGKVIKTTLNEDCQYITGSQMQKMLHTHFGPENNNRIVTYTNKKAVSINAHIREIHGHSGYWKKGELVTAKTACNAIIGAATTIIEQDYIVTDSNEIEEEVQIDGTWFNVATDHQLVLNAIKKASKDGDYDKLFKLKENWLDLRSGYAGTCHSVQGSTYQDVFVDLANFSRCYDIDTLVRLLYVAVSRAKGKVYFFGKPNFDLF